MRRSRTTFASEAGRFIHVGVFSVLSLVAVAHPVALPFLLLEGRHLWRHARSILFMALAAAAILLGRTAWIVSRPAFAETTFTGVVTATTDNRITVLTEGRRIFVYGDAAVEPGEVVTVVAVAYTYEPRSIEHGFDYGSYLRQNGVSGAVRATSVTVTGKRFVPACVAASVAAWVATRYDGEALSMLRLFLLGDSGALPDDLAETGRNLGIAHLFAVSGMHVGAVGLLLDGFLRRMHLRKGIRAGVVGFTLTLFAAICGCTVSVVRAVLGNLAATVNGLLKGPFTATDLFAFITVGVLIANPFAIASVGFQLSYLVTASILLGGTLVKTEDPIRKTLFVTLLANVVSLPILLEQNGSFNVAGIAANVVFVPFVEFLAVPLSLLVVLVPAAEPLLDLAGRGFFVAVAAAGTADLSIGVNFASDLAKAVYWLVAFTALVRLSSGKPVIWNGVAAAFLAFLCVLFPRPIAGATVTILDVGQGDAVAIAADGCRMLVDTGRTDSRDTLVNYYLKENVRHLDYVVLTHADDDHAGEIMDLDAAVDIGAIVSGGSLCPQCRARESIVRTGDSLVCGSLEFEVLSAGDPSENDGSVVLYGIIGEDRWLLMGDAGEDVEAQVEFPDVDVLKVGHHGSATATSALLLTKTTPAFAVLSVGRTNRYGHPDPDVLERLREADAVILRTDLLGSITFVYPVWGGRIIAANGIEGPFGKLKFGILRITAVFPSRSRHGIMGAVIG
jgi:competence protein ComEC